MKRKLNDLNVPEAVLQQKEHVVVEGASFDDLGLDPRLLQAIAKERYSAPTPIQSRAIPLVLEGKDVLGRATTGSGKTAAYVLPILQSILRRRAQATASRITTALILVPTKELASQVTQTLAALSSFCAKEINCINLAPQIADSAQRALLASAPDIVVSTPSRVTHHLNASTLVLANLSHLVVDEADYILRLDYEEDFKTLVNAIPKGVQIFLASATLNPEVNTLKGLFCRDPITVDLQEEEKGSSSLKQLVVRCAEDEKFLLTFALFKLKIIKGKTIVFVGDVDRCYRVKLYLEQFGIKSCVLNSELPLNSRIHVVEEFNKNVYDIIIATDEYKMINTEEVAEPPADGVTDKADVDGAEDGVEEKAKQRRKKRKTIKHDREYGVARGIDFRNVAFVLNFDLPIDARSYTHRIGRTARAGRPGTAISFVIPKEHYHKHKPTTFPTTEHDERVLAEIMQTQKANEQIVEDYQFDLAKLEGFRYRVTSALKAVTPGAIREARVRELREEMLKSEKLKRHLEENPEDLRYLRHDTELRPAKVVPHMRHVPDYLMPSGQGKDKAGLQDVGFVGIGRQSENRIRQVRVRNKMRGRPKKAAGRKTDPLKTFKAKR